MVLRTLPFRPDRRHSREDLAREDTDRDTFANWQEALCGTDPNDASDHLRATLRMENGVPVVDWNLASPMEGAARIVEGTSSLTSPTWTTDSASATSFRIRVALPSPSP